jgi:predicted CXXCH cytochrome family protein
MFGNEGTHRRMLAAVLAFAAPAFLLTACNDDPLFDLPPDPPTNVTAAVQNQSVSIGWTPGANATSQEVRVSPVVAVPASAGNSLQAEDLVQVFNDNTTNTALFEDLEPGPYTATVTAINASARVPSDPEPFTIAGAVNAPVITAFYADENDPTTLIVEWTGVEGAENYQVSLTADDESGDFSDIAASSATSFPFSPVNDGTTYTAQVCTFSQASGVGDCSGTLDFTADFFPWDEFLPTSLHATGAGKPTFYNASNGGFERFTGVPYDQLSCKNCHQSITDGDCTACHVGDPDPQLGAVIEDQATVCGACHGRQGSEVALGFGDVHRDAGVTCSGCHSLEDVHGDGNEYASMLDDGAVDAACENCHNLDSDPPIDPATHSGHGDALDCSTCHMKTVTTCYNCHFETELDFDRKVFYGPPPYPGPAAAGNSWVFLGNRVYGDGSTEVHLMNMQTLKFGTVADGDAVGFAAIAPYYGHTIMPKEDTRGCGDCHVNVIGPGGSAAQEYNASGQITIAEWVDAESRLVRPHNGIIPIPPDYLTSLQFDFVDLVDPANPPASGSDPASWQFLKAGADTIQILEQYGAPLTEEQMTKLGMEPPAP